MSTKRGRKPVPERWTRVISVHSDDLSEIRSFELASELVMDQSDIATTTFKGRPPAWEPIYWPPHIKKQHMDFKIEENRLNDENL